MSMMGSLEVRPIGVVRSPFVERVAAPRQPAAARSVQGTIELFPGHNFEHALDDLASWSFIWVLFWFHLNESWRPKVLPPRSDRKRGVFATRSPHRPNPIGLSALRLDGVEGLTLHVSGVDIIDQTPVLDIKPYVHYTDSLTEGTGWLENTDPKPAWAVVFEAAAQSALAYLRERGGLELEAAIQQTLELGPEPHPYRRIKQTQSGFVLAVKEWRAHFTVHEAEVRVTHLTSGYRPSALADTTRGELDVHRDFVALFAKA
jgi:tRNA-Thr(GGU) m(6)t(6)A37 methyltransferase TsaA